MNMFTRVLITTTLAAFAVFDLGFPATAFVEPPPPSATDFVQLLAEEEHVRVQTLAGARQALVSKVATMALINDKVLAERVTTALEVSCAEFGVDMEVMAALIGVESAGRPHVRSKVGAMGLTQIMPETGQWVAKKLGEPWTGADALLSPEVNIRYGTWYMGWLLDQFDGDQHAAFAAYFWGIGTISDKLAMGEELPVQYPEKIFNRMRI